MTESEKKTILVIEDDPDVLSVIIKHLDYLGYNVMTATDGMEGLKKLESGGYDLVVTVYCHALRQWGGIGDGH